MDKLDIFEAVNMIDEDIVKEAAADNAKPENTYHKDITVSGVEKYGGITWQRIAAIASAVLLIAGIGAGGALMLKRRPPVLVESVDTTAEDTTDNDGLKAGGGKEKSSSENAEATTVRTSESVEKATKESNNTEGEKDSNGDNAAVENTEAPREEDDAAVTTAVQTSLQWKTSPPAAETKPKPTTVTTAAVHYPEEKTTVPVTTQPEKTGTSWEIRSDIYALTCYPEDTAWLNTLLSSLSYQPYTCDGLPEGIFNGSDGNVYQLNFSEGWIWRNGREEAPMPDEIRQYFIGIME